MNEPTDYKVEYSYLRNGKRIVETDIFFDESVKGAIEQCKRCWGDEKNFDVLHVWKLIPACWCAMSID